MTVSQKRRGIAAVLVFVLLIHLSPRVVYFNLTGSMPLGLYLAIPGMSLRRGDIVVYDPPEKARALILARNYGDGKIHPFIKQVGALPGDVYCIMDDSFLVNGEEKGTVLRFDSQGNPMPVEDGHPYGQGRHLPSPGRQDEQPGRKVYRNGPA